MQEANAKDNELASEACFRAGLIHLLYRANQSNSYDIVSQLVEAKHWFDLAQQQVENRSDANFFSLVSQYFLSLLDFNQNSSDDFFTKLSQTLWERQVWGYATTSTLLEYRVFWSLSNLRVITERTSQERNWLDYKKEFLLICNNFNELIITDGLSHKLVNSFQAFAEYPITALINQYYIHNLSASLIKIEAIIASASPSEEHLVAFLSDLKSRIEGYNKKKSETPVGVVAALCSGFPHITPNEIIQDVDQLTCEQIDELQIQTKLAMRYADHMRLNQVSYATGYPIGDEVLISLVAKLKQLLPTYPPNKMAIFVSILSDLIRYTYQAETQPRKFFPHLYDPTVTLEEVFHNHLYIGLTAGNRATNYHYEESDVVGASRIDLVYKVDNIVFPIEVKKTDKRPDWDSIQKNYVAQVQMYNRPYSQLGCLVVFDITPKQKGKPLNDIRSLVNILHLTPYYQVEERYPDYVVAIIIPANKVSPSDYTTYI